MRNAILALMSVGLLICCCSAHGDIHILKKSGSEAEPAEATLTYNTATGGWDIHLLSLYAPSEETVYDITGDGGETIDNLFIEVDGPEAGSPLTVQVLSDDPLGIATIKNILQTGSAETTLLTVDVREDIGAVEVQVIGSLLAGRDVTGPVIATTEGVASRGITWIIAQNKVLGDVLTPEGRIGAIYAYGGIGSNDDPVTIECKYKINGLGGWGDVYANVFTRVNGGEGGIFSFYAERFFGTIDTQKLRNDQHTQSPGRLVVKYEFVGQINIGESLADPTQWIELPPGGLDGQITINGDAQDSGSWVCPVYLGAEGDPGRVELYGPYYSLTADEMGGGSVGLVPFALHGTSCVPAQGQTVEFDPLNPPRELRLRHYGPITWTGDSPVTVARRPIDSGGAYTILPPDHFVFSAADGDPNTLVVEWAGIGPTSRDSGYFEPGFEYRVQPTASLVSDVAATPPVSWVEDFTFGVEMPPCDGDLTEDGSVDIDDLFMVLAYWGPVGNDGSPADLNEDGIVDIDDLFAVLSLWGPC